MQNEFVGQHGNLYLKRANGYYQVMIHEDSFYSNDHEWLSLTNERDSYVLSLILSPSDIENIRKCREFLDNMTYETSVIEYNVLMATELTPGTEWSNESSCYNEVILRISRKFIDLFMFDDDRYNYMYSCLEPDFINLLNQ